MNLNDKTMKPSESNLASQRDLPEEIDSCMRVEPCEFESLLQRAMEILEREGTKRDRIQLVR